MRPRERISRRRRRCGYAFLLSCFLSLPSWPGSPQPLLDPTHLCRWSRGRPFCCRGRCSQRRRAALCSRRPAAAAPRRRRRSRRRAPAARPGRAPPPHVRAALLAAGLRDVCASLWSVCVCGVACNSSGSMPGTDRRSCPAPSSCLSARSRVGGRRRQPSARAHPLLRAAPAQRQPARLGGGGGGRVAGARAEHAAPAGRHQQGVPGGAAAWRAVRRPRVCLPGAGGRPPVTLQDASARLALPGSLLPLPTDPRFPFCCQACSTAPIDHVPPVCAVACPLAYPP